MNESFDSAEELYVPHLVGLAQASEKESPQSGSTKLGSGAGRLDSSGRMTSGISGAPICTGGASPLRVATGGNANWSSKVRCRRSPARANGRRDWRRWCPKGKIPLYP